MTTPFFFDFQSGASKAYVPYPVASSEDPFHALGITLHDVYVFFSYT
jgi:hypothetical protein